MAKDTEKTTGKGATPKKAATNKQDPAKQAVATNKPATVKKKAAAKKKATAKTRAAGGSTAKSAVRRINADERRSMVAEAAYLRGESQGFLSDELEDWLSAEAEVDAHLLKAGIAVQD